MARRGLILLLLLGHVATSGCMQRDYVEGFDGASVPEGWTAYGGAWRIVEAPGGERVLEGRGAVEPGLSSLVYDAFGNVSTFQLDVRLGILSGADPQGVGVVINWRGPGDYLILRYSTHEHGWHLFTVRDADRQKQERASVPDGTDPGFNAWMSLRVIQRHGEVVAWDGSTKVLAYRLESGEPAGGRLGMFVRGDSRAYFDSLRVTGR